MEVGQLIIWMLIVGLFVSVYREAKSNVDKGFGDKISDYPAYGEPTTHKEDMNYAIFAIIILTIGGLLMFIKN